MSTRLIIDAERLRPALSLSEIVQYHELLFMLAARDIKVRYRQAVVGLAWALMQPLFSLLLFLTLFGWLDRHPVSNPKSYALSALCGLIPWQFMANVMLQSTNSLVSNRHLIAKVYFPRALIPLSSVGCAFFDFVMSSLLLIGLMAWQQVPIGWHCLELCLWIPLLIVAATGAALWLSALNGLFRDFAFVVPFAVQMGMFASPVVYESSSLVPPAWRVWFAINPLTGILDGIRASLLGTDPPAWPLQVISAVSAVILCVTGSLFFSRVERTIADRI